MYLNKYFKYKNKYINKKIDLKGSGACFSKTIKDSIQTDDTREKCASREIVEEKNNATFKDNNYSGDFCIICCDHINDLKSVFYCSNPKIKHIYHSECYHLKCFCTYPLFLNVKTRNQITFISKIQNLTEIDNIKLNHIWSDELCLEDFENKYNSELNSTLIKHISADVENINTDKFKYEINGLKREINTPTHIAKSSDEKTLESYLGEYSYDIESYKEKITTLIDRIYEYLQEIKIGDNLMNEISYDILYLKTKGTIKYVNTIISMLENLKAKISYMITTQFKEAINAYMKSFKDKIQRAGTKGDLINLLNTDLKFSFNIKQDKKLKLELEKSESAEPEDSKEPEEQEQKQEQESDFSI